MLETMLRRAAALHRAKTPPRFWPSGPFGRLVAGEPLSPTEFATLDDSDITFAIKAWATDPEPYLSMLARGLLHRELYKPLTLPDDDARADELIHAARALAHANGLDPELTVLVDSSSDSLYRPFAGVRATHEDSIRLVDSQGRVTFIEDRSAVVKMLSHLHVRQRLVCLHPSLRDAVAKKISLARS
jgi:hypothetical protein